MNHLQIIESANTQPVKLSPETLCRVMEMLIENGWRVQLQYLYGWGWVCEINWHGLSRREYAEPWLLCAKSERGIERPYDAFVDAFRKHLKGHKEWAAKHSAKQDGPPSLRLVTLS